MFTVVQLRLAALIFEKCEKVPGEMSSMHAGLTVSELALHEI